METTFTNYAGTKFELVKTFVREDETWKIWKLTTKSGKSVSYSISYFKPNAVTPGDLPFRSMRAALREVKSYDRVKEAV